MASPLRIALLWILVVVSALSVAFVSHLCREKYSELTAMERFNLDPLCMHRDIAMFALLHKVSLGVAPEPTRSLFNMRAGTLDHLGFLSFFS